MRKLILIVALIMITISCAGKTMHTVYDANYFFSFSKVERPEEAIQRYGPKKIGKDAHIRLKFKESGIDIIVRYMSLAKRRNQITTDITREIYNQISNSEDVEIAYPHTEVVFRNKDKKGKD